MAEKREPPQRFQSEEKVKAETRLEITGGQIAYVAEPVEEVESALFAQPPARWLNLTLIFADNGHPYKTWRRVRGDSIIAIGPAEPVSNTG
jgi:hypothetical protein